MEKVKITRKKISSLRRGQKVFQSTGLSELKVTTYNQESNQIEIVCLEIPIKSTGISELIDAFNEKAPKPPAINKLVEADSEIGKELGLTKKNAIKIFDLTDPTYLKQKEAHDSKLGIAIVMKGMDLQIEDEQGEVITDDEEKIKVMKEMGLSGEHFTQLVNDISSLTKWNQDEKENFLE